jgi:Holliday junction resolvase RusA-like endonuclease
LILEPYRKVNIKPLSVNETWQGKRFKTQKYKDYELKMLFILPSIEIPEGKLRIDIIYGFSNKSSDIDNPCKPFIDILQKKYGFNDSRIYFLTQSKEIVEKGQEFIKFTVNKYID